MRHNMFRFGSIAFVATVAVASGCATPQPRHPTVSGNPEVVIQGVSRKQVIDAIVEAELNKGMQLRSVNEYGVVVARKIDGSFMASLLYGSRYDSIPEARIHYNVVEVGSSSVKLFSRLDMVTNPGSGFERTSDATSSVASDLQLKLDSIAIILGTNPLPRYTSQGDIPDSQLISCKFSDGSGLTSAGECRKLGGTISGR